MASFWQNPRIMKNRPNSGTLASFSGSRNQMSDTHSQHDHEIVIESQTRLDWQDVREFVQYFDLLYFMVWRTIKVAYAQSIGGFAWALVQPAMQILVFSLVFGQLLKAGPDDGTPFVLFVTIATIPWTYMSGVLNGASNSLVANAGMLAKIYFPRFIYLLTPVFSSLVPFVISLLLVAGVMVYYQVPITGAIVYLPLMLLLMIVTPLSIALWLSSLAMRFRDVRIVMGYILRMLIYTVPVMYSSDKIPPEYRELYILNPFVGIIEGFNACLLGKPMYWDSLIVSIVVSFTLLITGAFYFKRMERIIVDVA